MNEYHDMKNYVENRHTRYSQQAHSNRLASEISSGSSDKAQSGSRTLTWVLRFGFILAPLLVLAVFSTTQTKAAALVPEASSIQVANQELSTAKSALSLVSATVNYSRANFASSYSLGLKQAALSISQRAASSRSYQSVANAEVLSSGGGSKPWVTRSV